MLGQLGLLHVNEQVFQSKVFGVLDSFQYLELNKFLNKKPIKFVLFCFVVLRTKSAVFLQIIAQKIVTELSLASGGTQRLLPGIEPVPS